MFDIRREIEKSGNPPRLRLPSVRDGEVEYSHDAWSERQQ